MGLRRLDAWFFMAGMLALSGCATPPKQDDVNYAPTRPIAPPPAPTHSGSLYRAGYEMRLFEDVVARQVGDILTIRLVEKTDAKKKADTCLLYTSDAADDDRIVVLWGGGGGL